MWLDEYFVFAEFRHLGHVSHDVMRQRQTCHTGVVVIPESHEVTVQDGTGLRIRLYDIQDFCLPVKRNAAHPAVVIPSIRSGNCRPNVEAVHPRHCEEDATVEAYNPRD